MVYVSQNQNDLGKLVKNTQLLLLFSLSVVSSYLGAQRLQHTRLSCPSPSPRACSNSCPLSHWCYPTISPSVGPFILLSSIFPSIRVSSNESSLHIRWSKYWSFNFSISFSSEYSGLISFRIDWFDLHSVQESLRCSPTWQFKCINSSGFSFFMVQVSHAYTTTGKAIALTRWTFVSKVMSLLFNVLSRFVIAFLPSRKHLLPS